MNPEDIKAIFGMKPEAAVEYLKQKGVAVSWDWQDMLDDAHATAFTVAKTAGMDVANAFITQSSKLQRPAKHWSSFRKHLHRYCKAKVGGDAPQQPIRTPAKPKLFSSVARTA